MQTLPLGTSLQGGKYIIKGVLGQGGFGITYLASHTIFGYDVAIKEFFIKQYCEREETSTLVNVSTLSNIGEVRRYEEKFLKEAQIINKLDHPNIIKIHDVFRENNTAYYVMDYIDGESLSHMISRRGALPEREALAYIRQAGRALAYIHSLHLNHLDVKPANLMCINQTGRIVLIDFGMSKQYDTISGDQTSTTPVGISHGYAPIEQYQEGGVREFSPQTDIYALGATLYKLVTGQTPPPASDIINQGLPQLPTSISASTQQTIAQAMSLRKDKRQSSVHDFLSSLRDPEPKPAVPTYKKVLAKLVYALSIIAGLFTVFAIYAAFTGDLRPYAVMPPAILCKGLWSWAESLQRGHVKSH